MLAYDGIAEPEYDNTHANRIRLLKQNDLLPYEVKNTLYILRKDRNNAAHNASDEGARALSNLELLYPQFFHQFERLYITIYHLLIFLSKFF